MQVTDELPVKKGRFLGEDLRGLATLAVHIPLVLSGISVQIKRSMRFNPEQGPAQS